MPASSLPQTPIDASLYYSSYIAILTAHIRAAPSPLLLYHSGLRPLLASSPVYPSKILNVKDQELMLALSFADSVTILLDFQKLGLEMALSSPE